MKNQIDKILELIAKHPYIFITCLAITISLSVVYVYVSPHLYTSEIKLEHKNSINNSILINPVTAAMEEIKSPSFIKSSISGNGEILTQYIEKDFQKSESKYLFPYTIQFAVNSKNFTESEYTINETSDGSFQLISKIFGEETIKTGSFGKEIIDNNFTFVINKKNNPSFISAPLTGETKFSFRITSPEYFSNQLANQNNLLTVTDKNNVLTIKCSNEDPEIAKMVSTSLANRYLSSAGNDDLEGTNYLEMLNRKIEIASSSLAKTESQIADYKKKNQITELNFDTENSLSALKELQQQKTHYEMNLSALNNLSNYLRKNRDVNNSTVEYGAITDPVFSEQISKLNEKYQSKNNGLDNAGTDAEIENLKVLIAERILNTRKRFAVQLDEVNSKIASLEYQISLIPDKANTLKVLDRQYTLDKKVYDLLVEKRAMAIVSGHDVTSGNRIIKPASIIPNSKAESYASAIPLGILIGAIAGLICSFLKQYFTSSKITVRNELSEKSTIPFLGTISAAKNQADLNNSISNLCTRILLKPDVKTISVTSTIDGEGKTFIAAKLARAFSALDKKVLVIDMNILNPQLAGLYEVNDEKTLADVLLNNCDIHDAINITSYPNLDILTSGILPDGINTLLASKKRTTILEDLKKHYDLIIIDTPATNHSIDAIPMMKNSDLNIYVTRANTTKIESLNAAELIKSDYSIDNMYFVLNSFTSGNKSKNKQLRKPLNDNTVDKYKANDMSRKPEFLRKIALWFY